MPVRKPARASTEPVIGSRTQLGDAIAPMLLTGPTHDVGRTLTACRLIRIHAVSFLFN